MVRKTRIVVKIEEYKMYIAQNDVILIKWNGTEYKQILRLSSVNAIKNYMSKQGIILTDKNCKFIYP